MPLVFEYVSLPHDRDATSRTSSNDHGRTTLWSMSGLRSPRMGAARNDPCSVVAEAVPCLLRIFVSLLFLWPADVSVLDINAIADLSTHFSAISDGRSRGRARTRMLYRDRGRMARPTSRSSFAHLRASRTDECRRRCVTALQPPTMAMPRISRDSHQRVRSRLTVQFTNSNIHPAIRIANGAVFHRLQRRDDRWTLLCWDKCARV
jgi:hypothetical protein